LYECQNTGVTKFAIRKWLILKGAILVGLGLQGGNGGLEKEMREQAPALHTQLSTPLSMPENRRKSRKISKARF
jgi:hypothetical protein